MLLQMALFHFLWLSNIPLYISHYLYNGVMYVIFYKVIFHFLYIYWTGSLMYCSPWGPKESDMTEWWIWSDLIYIYSITYLMKYYSAIKCIYIIHIYILSIHLSMDIYVASMSWLLWRVLTWTLGSMYILNWTFLIHRWDGPALGFRKCLTSHKWFCTSISWKFSDI